VRASISTPRSPQQQSPSATLNLAQSSFIIGAAGTVRDGKLRSFFSPDAAAAGSLTYSQAGVAFWRQCAQPSLPRDVREGIVKNAH
jgi:hypothetical protein